MEPPQPPAPPQPPVSPPSADGLHGALEVAGGLQLQLVRHGVDLEAVQPDHKGKRPPSDPQLPHIDPKWDPTWDRETSEGDGGEGDPKMDPNLPQNGTPKGTWDQHCGMGEQDPKIDPNLPHICPKWDPRGTWDQQWGMGE